MLGLLAAAIGVIALPASAAAQNADAANGSDCSYTDTNLGVVGVETGGDGMTGDDSATAVGACANSGDGSGFEGGSVEVGTGPEGTYVVVDGDNQNTDPGDGYMGLSSYENGDFSDEDCSNGPDQGDDQVPGNGDSTNSGGCFGVDGAPPATQLDLTALRDLGVPTPICGNTSGNSWWDTGRDGCSNP